MRKPGQKKKQREVVIGTDDEDDEAREELEWVREKPHKRPKQKSKVFAKATEAAEATLKERLHGGQTLLAKAGEGKEGIAQLVEKVASALKLSIVPTQAPCREQEEK